MKTKTILFVFPLVVATLMAATVQAKTSSKVNRHPADAPPTNPNAGPFPHLENCKNISTDSQNNTITTVIDVFGQVPPGNPPAGNAPGMILVTVMKAAPNQLLSQVTPSMAIFLANLTFSQPGSPATLGVSTLNQAYTFTVVQGPNTQSAITIVSPQTPTTPSNTTTSNYSCSTG